MNGQGLQFRFSTDLEPAKRSLTSFAQHAGTQLALVGGASVAAARNLDAMSGAAVKSANVLKTGVSLYTTYKVAMLGVAVGAAAFSAAVGIAAHAIDNLNRIATGARNAGVDSTFFQVWERQAEKLRLKAEDLSSALVKARDATKLSVDSSGNREDSTAAKALRDLQGVPGITGGMLDTVANSNDAQARIMAVLDAMRALHEEADRINNQDLRLMAERLGNLTFGENVGRQLSEAISRGDMQMAQLMARAEETGSVFSRELVDQAEEVSRKITEAGNRVSDELKPAVEQLAAALLSVKSLWGDILNLIADAIGKAKEFASVVQTAASWARYLNPLTRGIDAITSLPGAVGAVAGPAGVMQGAAQGPFGGLSSGGFAAPVMASSIVRRLRQQALQDGGVFSRVGAPTESKGKGGKAAAADDYDAVKALIENMEKSIRLLEAEAQAIGKNAVERAKIIELAKAEEAARERGTPLTAEEIKRTEELAAKKAMLTEQIKKQKEAEQGVKDAMSYVGNNMLDAFDAIVMRGEKASEVAANLARTLAKAALQAALLGEGSFAGIFGTKGGGGLFGLLGGALGIGSLGSGGGAGLSAVGGGSFAGLYAEGGTIPAGKWGIVGEKGPEPVFGPANVLPNRVLRQGRGGPTVQNHFHIGSVTTPEEILRAANAAAAQMSMAARKGAFADVFDHDRRHG